MQSRNEKSIHAATVTANSETEQTQANSQIENKDREIANDDDLISYESDDSVLKKLFQMQKQKK